MKRSQEILWPMAVVLLALLLPACAAKHTLTISVTEPAVVSVPAYIKKVGIVNRTLHSEENEKFDKIDKVLSIEGKNLDKDGANEAVLGLFDEVGKNDRFTEVKMIDNAAIKSPGLGIFPAPLDWETVKQICLDNQVDAIFALSLYDTDGSVNYKAVPLEVNAPLGISVPVIEHHATIATLIKTGWRIYDPVNQIVLDEVALNETQVSSGKGINPVKAVEAVMGRKQAVMQVSRNLGYSYALRILPYSIRVTRWYFVRGTDNFKIAKRRAQTGNWDGAAELWKIETTHPKRKVAGRACHNMAIINEINGDLEAAVEWAATAYEDYKNKTALRYLNILKGRIASKQQLQQQMEY